MDGFSNELFKALIEDLVPRLESLYSYIFHIKRGPKTWNEEKVVLPKPHKDLKKPDS